MKSSVENAALAFADTGRGVPILWIHGFPLNRSMWSPQARDLSADARHICPDLRGFGESPRAEGTMSMGQYADDLRGLLDTLNIKQAVIAGLSMGGYIAMSFAGRYPERMLGLILADTRPGADSPEAAAKRRDDAERVMREGTPLVLAPMLAKLLGVTTQAGRPDLVELVRTMVNSAPAAGVAAALRGLAERPDSAPMLPRIAVPTLIIVGAEDVITPPAESRRMAELIGGAALVEIPKAGHLANLEQPDGFNRAVREFLANVAA